MWHERIIGWRPLLSAFPALKSPGQPVYGSSFISDLEASNKPKPCGTFINNSTEQHTSAAPNGNVLQWGAVWAKMEWLRSAVRASQKFECVQSPLKSWIAFSALIRSERAWNASRICSFFFSFLFVLFSFPPLLSLPHSTQFWKLSCLCIPFHGFCVGECLDHMLANGKTLLIYGTRCGCRNNAVLFILFPPPLLCVCEQLK